MTPQPALDGRAFVSARIVEDEVEVQVARGLAVDAIEKAQELLGAVPWQTGADHLPIEQVEGGEQRGGSVPMVVVGLPSREPRPQRQERRRPVEGLNLALLVDREHQGVIGWIEIEADDIAQFLHKARVAGELEALHSMGLQAVLSPNAVDGGVPEPLGLAIVRTLQCVAPGGVVWSVASTTALIFSAPIIGLRPGRGFSKESPGTPPRAKRSRQSRTVGRLTPTSRAMAPFGRPAAASRMIRARCASFCGVLP
jgi:hypothetical protein